MLGDTFFKNEIEYIIAGKPDDKSNLSQVRSKIIAIRSAVNFANFLSDEKKKKEALLMAQIITCLLYTSRQINELLLQTIVLFFYKKNSEMKFIPEQYKQK